VGRAFKSELAALPQTYKWALQLSSSKLASLIGPPGHPLYVVGSGGSLSAAHLVADLYETTVGVPARVETPLGLPRALRSLRTCNVLILSAAGRNRDILGACRQAIEFEPKQLSVVCATEGSPLAKLAQTYDGAAVLEFELPTGRDGFLATNSLLATAVLMTRAIGGATTERLLPATFKSLAKGCQGVRTGVASEHFFERETLLVLHGDQTRAGAIDLESKLTEAALARVQVADYRNFAHGRHHWLAKRPRESAVLAFETPFDRTLAERTLALLPRDVPTLRICIPHECASIASLASLASVFHVVDQYGDARKIDPGRPGVPPFGRRIYNLNAFSPRRSSPKEAPTCAVRRKLNAIGVPNNSVLERRLRAAWNEQVGLLAQRRFRALVLDYDGTICDREHRYGVPPAEIVSPLEGLLARGVLIGIATGRGGSVREALRQCISQEHWTRVVVGYYNCGEIATLADDQVPRKTTAAGKNLEAAAEALSADLSIGALCEVEPRHCQITVRARVGIPIAELGLWSLVHESIKRAGVTDVAVVSSSHSVDLIPDTCSKLDLLRRLPAVDLGEMLCIGDRGRWPGNDWQLLNHKWSLSVDEVSSAVDRGWNLAPPGRRGVGALEFYLSRLRSKGDRFGVDLRTGRS
jgi:hypothetical protein